VRDAFPDKRVTLVAGKRGLLGTLSPPTSERLVKQMHELMASRGVAVVSENAESPKFAEADATGDGFLVPRDGTVVTSSGLTVKAGVVLFAVGAALRLTSIYPDAWRDPATGELLVEHDHRVRGRDDVFAVGDVARTLQGKFAYVAGADAQRVAHNVVDVAVRRIAPTRTFADPKPGSKTNIALPFGASTGRTYAFGWHLGDYVTSVLKGRDLGTGTFYKLLTGERAPTVATLSE